MSTLPRAFLTAFCTSLSLAALCQAGTGLRDTLRKIELVEVVVPASSPLRPGNDFITFNPEESLEARAITVALGNSLLASLPGLALRQNGSGGIATPRVDGLASSRLGSTWSGIQVNDPQVGSVDLQQVVPYLNPLSLQRNSAQAAIGTGISARSLPTVNPTKEISLTARAGLGYALATALSPTPDLAVRGYIENDAFAYRHRVGTVGGRVFEEAPGANLLRLGMSASLGPKDPLDIAASHNAFVLSTRRRLPLPAGEVDQAPASLATDQARYLLKVDRSPSTSWYAGALYNRLRYEDEARSLLTRSHSTQMLAGLRQQFGKLGVEAEVRGVHTRNTSYTRQALLGQGYARSTYEHKVGKFELKADLGLQAHGITGVWPTGGVDVTLPKSLLGLGEATLSLRRVARSPVLDDLLWAKGGTTSIEPERGWSGQLDYTHQGAVRLALSAYARSIKNYIIWLPAQPFWQPQNTDQVNAYGARASVRHTLRVGAVRLRVGGSMSYTQAHARFSQAPLPFNPSWLSTLQARTAFKCIALTALYRHTGRQTTSFDGSLQLPQYGMLDLLLSMQHERYVASLSATNFLNQPIPTAERYPMPQRRLSITLSRSL